MRIERYYAAASGEIVQGGKTRRWMLTFPCGHQHSREGAIACALRRGEPIIAEFTERRTYGPEGAEPLVECALTAIEEVHDGGRYDGAQSEIVPTIYVPADEGVSDDDEMRALDRLLEELRRDES